MEKVDVEIRDYVEAEILPRYNKLGGHTDEHVRQVIERSLRFAPQAPEIDVNMAYVIAAFHDLGRLVDDETHNFESAKMLRADEFVREHFSAEQIDTMAEAIEDHRASLGREPRSIYGKLVSSADRNSSIDELLSRCYDYTKHLHPEMTDDELCEEARIHLREKYSPDGYAAKTMYFDDPDFQEMLVKTEEMTRTTEGFTKIQKEFNAKRFSK
jgi:uncharacterized protein